MSDEGQMRADFASVLSNVERELTIVVHELTDGAYQAALTRHRWQNRTGATAAALKRTIASTGSGVEGVVSVDSENALRLNNGTRPHRIEAHGRALRFEVGGQTLFRPYVNHPGTAPDPYLDAAADEVEGKFDGMVVAALDKALR